MSSAKRITLIRGGDVIAIIGSTTCDEVEHSRRRNYGAQNHSQAIYADLNYQIRTFACINR